MDASTRYTVVGAGHGGKAMTAHLALMGFPTTLFNRTPAHVEVIRLRGGIELESYEGGPHGFGAVELVTSDMAEALAQAEIIMVVVPSTAHTDIARLMVPFLRDGQIVVLNPGRTCGAIAFANVLRDHNCHVDVTIAEAETLLYACRSEGPAQAHIFSTKASVPLATLPATRTRQVLEALESAFPQFIDGVNVLHTGLNNMGAIFHPALTLLNAGRIESTGGDFQFYIEGVTSTVAHVLEVLDRERVTVASSLGIRARTAQEWLQIAYNATGQDLFEAIHDQPGYKGIKGPMSLNHRYLTEDVPMSLVPIADLGRRYGVSVRGIDSIICLASIAHQTDYWRRGRTLQKLGIESFSVGELLQYVTEGFHDERHGMSL